MMREELRETIKSETKTKLKEWKKCKDENSLNCVKGRISDED